MENKLSELQLWMQKAITQQQPIKHQSINTQAVVQSTNKLSATERLGIYQTSYWLRLIDCLTAIYPALEKFTGKELFQLFAEDYLRTHPPTSYTLSELGEYFPAFLKKTKPAETQGVWSDLIIELAEFEYLFGKTYDNEGSEELQLLTSAELLALTPSNLLKHPFQFVPNVLFPEFNYPIKNLFNQLRSKEETDYQNIKPSRTRYCIFRHQYKVRIIELEEGQFQVLQGIYKNPRLEDLLPISTMPEKAQVLAILINFTDLGLFLV